MSFLILFVRHPNNEFHLWLIIYGFNTILLHNLYSFCAASLFFFLSSPFFLPICSLFRFNIISTPTKINYYERFFFLLISFNYFNWTVKWTYDEQQCLGLPRWVIGEAVAAFRIIFKFLGCWQILTLLSLLHPGILMKIFHVFLVQLFLILIS